MFLDLEEYQTPGQSWVRGNQINWHFTYPPLFSILLLFPLVQKERRLYIPRRYGHTKVNEYVKIIHNKSFYHSFHRNTYYIPNSVLGTVFKTNICKPVTSGIAISYTWISYLILANTQGCRFLYSPHFAEENPETQIKLLIYTLLYKLWVQNQNSQSDIRGYFFFVW